MSDYTGVALGFAEFVGQLLTETFEATVKAQHYQIDRYVELQGMLDLPDEEFLARFVEPQAILDREVMLAGAPIARQMHIADEYQQQILELTEEFEDHSVIYRDRLTNYGFEALRRVIDEALVSEQKSQLQILLQRLDQMRLVVDSGEVKAKLQLTNVFQQGAVEVGDEVAEKNIAASAGKRVAQTTKEAATDKANQAAVNDKSTGDSSNTSAMPAEEMPPLIGDKLHPGIKTLKDTVTQETVLLFDKELLNKSTAVGSNAPVRISAKPVSGTSSSELFSEVTIRFKTV